MSDESRVLSGRYRVDDVIGRGGMATVYRGYDLTLGRTVAIKILDKQLARDSVFRTRFRMEAQAASRMSNPTIVRVYDAGEDDAGDEVTPYIVMELVSGQTLKQVIASGPVPVSDALRYVDGILEALEYSHRAGVIHRDIKPGNVMITEDGRVKVMDFGIALAVSDSSSTVAETTSILGTAAYFSPEQAKGEPVDARTDLYSTGIVLYELLTGRQPFRGDTPVAVAYQHVSETPLPPSELVPSVPRALDAIVLRALAKDPFSRFPDASTFREAIAGAAEGRTPTKRQLADLTNELYGANPRIAAETARSLRQLSSDTTMTRTQQGPPVAWIWTGVVVVAVLVISLMFWVLSLSRNTPTQLATTPAPTIADVSDMGVDRAKQILTEQGIVLVTVLEPSATIVEGNVIRTEPAAGEPFQPGDEVELVVSSGRQMAIVPTLVGLSEADATKALKDANLTAGRVKRMNDPANARDVVLSASAEAGVEVEVGTTVDLIIATGNVSVVDYSKYGVDAAVAELEKLQLSPTVVNAPECSAQPSPVVERQSVVGDVPIHSEVQLFVCSGP